MKLLAMVELRRRCFKVLIRKSCIFEAARRLAHGEYVGRLGLCMREPCMSVEASW